MQEVRRSIEGGEEIISDILPLTSAFVSALYHLTSKNSSIFLLPSSIFHLTSVIENGFWQGTLIYMEIGTNEEIDPNQIVDHRTDAAEEYNVAFVETGELESLW